MQDLQRGKLDNVAFKTLKSNMNLKGIWSVNFVT